MRRSETMLAAHAEGRDYLGTLAGLPSRAERAAAALLYVQVMREHIDKENNLIFPAADRLFTPEEQAMLAQCYREMEVRTFGTGFHEIVLAELDRIEQAIPG
jgi:hemerythrin-like domain-containing protein